MAREFAKVFYNSSKWKKCRYAYIKYRQSVDGGLCESCHEQPGYIVHHKEELTPENINDPVVTLSFSNLKYDCHVCHQKENLNEAADGLVMYEFNADGQIVESPLNEMVFFKRSDHGPTDGEYTEYI